MRLVGKAVLVFFPPPARTKKFALEGVVKETIENGSGTWPGPKPPVTESRFR